MVAGGDARHPGADLADDPGTFMAQDRREDPFRIETVERVGVGMADSGRLDLDQHFAGLRPLQVELDDLERLLGLERDGGSGLHDISLGFLVRRL